MTGTGQTTQKKREKRGEDLAESHGGVSHDDLPHVEG
jgi:hypothetical protein